MAIQGVSFQGYVPQYEKRRNTNVALLAAPVLTAATLATEMLDKSNRKKGIIDTAKACIKSLNKSVIGVSAGFCEKVLRSENLASKVKNLSPKNKWLTAGVLALDTLANFAVVKMGTDIGSKIKHRNG